jgi:hypothetical protein
MPEPTLTSLPGTIEQTFKASLEQVAWMVATVSQGGTSAWTHDTMEAWVKEQGREFERRFLQGMLDGRAAAEVKHEAVVGSDQIERTHRTTTTRQLGATVGEVKVTRLAYSAREHESIMPLDAELSLPGGKYSNGVKREAVLEATRGSFDEAQRSIERHTGLVVPKRQLINLVQDAAVDFEAFYDSHRILPVDTSARRLLVLTCDGKGVVMRPEGLREATRKAAEASEHKLKTRLSKGEKGDRKRMATVAAVYEVAPFVRLPEEVLDPTKKDERPKPIAKRVWARLDLTTEEVVSHLFDEAEMRDAKHEKEWVVLVDGANHQIDVVRKVARKRKVDVTIVVDFIHVLEYLWKAAWEFFKQGDPEAEKWVEEKALEVLRGNASIVAGAIRRSATRRNLTKRENADICCDYLIRKSQYLRYDVALRSGSPIATGVIEGACRHLVVDRMDITGARWGLDGGEAILRLRAIKSSGDFDEYWKFHQRQSHRRTYPDDYVALAA